MAKERLQKEIEKETMERASSMCQTIELSGYKCENDKKSDLSFHS
jgi:hypothetical protein